MNVTKKIMSLMILTVLISACASQKAAVKKVETEISQEPVAKETEVTQNVRDYILNSKTISDQQKTELLTLQDKTSAQATALDEELNKARMILVRTVLQPRVNEREVSILRKKIKKLSRKSMELEYKAFAEARKIIDPMKEARDREFLYNSFIMRRKNMYW